MFNTLKYKSPERLLAVSVFIVLTAHNFIWWFEVYGYSEQYLSTLFTLELFVNQYFSPEVERSTITLYDAIAWLFPVLVLFKHWGARILFYCAFVWVNFIGDGSYQNVIVLGLYSQALFTSVVAVFGFLLCSDLIQNNLTKRTLVELPRNTLFSLAVFAVSLGTVLATVLGAQDSKTTILQDFLTLYPEFSAAIYLTIPYLQLGCFLALSWTVFLTSKKKWVAIVLSWIVITIPVGLRIEWTGFFYFLDTYILLSAVLVWSILAAPKETQILATKKLSPV